MAMYKLSAIALVAAVGFSSFEGSVASAAETGAVRAIEVEAGALPKVLDEFARVTNQKIEFDRKSLDRRQSPGVQGRLSISDALKALLKGTGAGFDIKDDVIHVVAVGDANARVEELPTVQISAGTVFSALRGDSSLRDVPQSVQIMSAKQLSEQNSFSLADALGRANGITVVSVNENMPVVAARGFRVTNMHVDSGAAMDMVSTATTPLAGMTDMGAYERVEILRGADALFGGNGNPGASISLIRKEPGFKDAAKVELSAGSWNRYRAEVDANAVLNSDGSLRVRGDLVSLTNDYFYDSAFMRFKKAFGVLAYDIAPGSTVQFGGSYATQKSRDVTAGLPRFPDGADANLPRSLGVTFPWSYYNRDTTEVFAKLNHEINEKWQVKAAVTYVKGKAEYANAQFQDPLSPVTFAILGKPNVTYTLEPGVNTQIAGDITLTGSFTAFDRRTDVMLGADYQNFEGTSRYNYLQKYNYNTGNLFAFDPNSFKDPRLDPTGNAAAITTTGLQKQRSNGFYGSLRFHITDNLALIGGGRRSSIAIASQSSMSLGTFSFNTSTPPAQAHKFTPFGGAVYTVDESTSVYLSYADIYSSNFGKKDRTGAQLDAVSGVNSELGIKKSWNRGRLNGSFAIYSIRQKNLAFPDLSAPNPTGDKDCCYLPNGLNTSRGIEAELSGKITPDWEFSAGYTLNNNSAKFGEVLGTFTPRHLIRLWSSYRLPAPLDKMTVGANVQAQSANYTTGTYFIGKYCSGITAHCGDGVYTFTDTQGRYLIGDLRVAYEINKQLMLSATVNNIGDVRYFSVIGAPYAGSTYGTPRNYLIKLEAKI